EPLSERRVHVCGAERGEEHAAELRRDPAADYEPVEVADPEPLVQALRAHRPSDLWPMPASRARTIAWARSATWSLLKTFDTWLRTVFGLTTNRWAISAFPSPWAISSSPSRSRSVKSGNGGGMARAAEKKPIMRCA